MEIHVGEKVRGRSHDAEAEGSTWEQTQQRGDCGCSPGLGGSGYSRGLSGKESTWNAVASGDASSVPGLGRSPGEGDGNRLQYSCLENPMGRRAWRATVQRVSKSQTRLKQLIMHAHTCTRIQGNTYEGCS